MERLGCPPRFLNMVIQLHDDQRFQVRLNGDLSEPFAISNGVKQGCVLAPTLFSIFFSMMLRQATEDLNDDDSIYIRYRLDGNLFNLRRLQAHTKTQEQLIRDLLFADDAALVAHTERALQRLTSCFAEAAHLFGLEISLQKTEVLHQPAPQEEYHPPHISIDETELNTVHKFAYLGCIISSDAKIDKEIDNRLANANSAFGRLYKRVCGNKHLKNSTKISVSYGSPMDDTLVVTIPKDPPLSSSDMSILKQGLSFIPNPHTVDEFEIRCDFGKFARRMRLFAHFDENPIKEQSQPCKDITTYTFNDPFERLRPKTSSWTPPEGQHPSPDVFISKCRIDINNILNNHVTSMHSNNSSEDRNAIKRLQERKDIVIKPVDKGGAIVVWRRDLYFQEALRQFSNTDFYYPVENDPTPHQQDIITATVAELISQKSLPNTATNLIQDNPRCSMFYLLPKIHKVDNPGRPIVSTINCNSEIISQYLDGIFFPIVTKLPTFIKDTSDVIRLCKDFKFTDDYQCRYLFTMDICSLCTNIPTAEGLAAHRYYLE